MNDTVPLPPGTVPFSTRTEEFGTALRRSMYPGADTFMDNPNITQDKFMRISGQKYRQKHYNKTKVELPKVVMTKLHGDYEPTLEFTQESVKFELAHTDTGSAMRRTDIMEQEGMLEDMNSAVVKANKGEFRSPIDLVQLYANIEHNKNTGDSRSNHFIAGWNDTTGFLYSDHPIYMTRETMGKILFTDPKDKASGAALTALAKVDYGVGSEIMERKLDKYRLPRSYKGKRMYASAAEGKFKDELVMITSLNASYEGHYFDGRGQPTGAAVDVFNNYFTDSFLEYSGGANRVKMLVTAKQRQDRGVQGLEDTIRMLSLESQVRDSKFALRDMQKEFNASKRAAARQLKDETVRLKEINRSIKRGKQQMSVDESNKLARIERGEESVAVDPYYPVQSGGASSSNAPLPPQFGGASSSNARVFNVNDRYLSTAELAATVDDPNQVSDSDDDDVPISQRAVAMQKPPSPIFRSAEEMQVGRPVLSDSEDDGQMLRRYI